MANEEIYATDLSVQERFWAKVNKNGPNHPYDSSKGACWIWGGCFARGGYGQLWMGGKMRMAHRLSVAMDGRAVMDGQVSLHTCDRPSCVNPGHINLGTQLENMAEKVSRGRSLTGERHHKAKLSEADVRNIRSSHAKGVDLSAKYGVSTSAISAARSGRSWTHIK